MNVGRYELRKGNDRNGKWEVAHYWADGATIQVKYFKTKREAAAYIGSHFVQEEFPFMAEGGAK